MRPSFPAAKTLRFLGGVVVFVSTFLLAQLIVDWTSIPAGFLEITLFSLLIMWMSVIRSHWLAGLFLLTTQIYLFNREPQRTFEYRFMSDVIMSVSVVSVAMLYCGVTLLPGKKVSEVIRILRTPDERSALLDFQYFLSGWDVIWSLIDAILLRVAAAIMLALLVLYRFPIQSSSVRDLRLTPTGLRAITIGIVLSCIVILVSTLVRVIGWYRLSPQESRTYLATSSASDLYLELRSISKRRMYSQARTKTHRDS